MTSPRRRCGSVALRKFSEPRPLKRSCARKRRHAQGRTCIELFTDPTFFRINECTRVSDSLQTIPVWAQVKVTWENVSLIKQYLHEVMCDSVTIWNCQAVVFVVRWRDVECYFCRRAIVRSTQSAVWCRRQLGLFSWRTRMWRHSSSRTRLRIWSCCCDAFTQSSGKLLMSGFLHVHSPSKFGFLIVNNFSINQITLLMQNLSHVFLPFLCYFYVQRSLTELPYIEVKLPAWKTIVCNVFLRHELVHVYKLLYMYMHDCTSWLVTIYNRTQWVRVSHEKSRSTDRRVNDIWKVFDSLQIAVRLILAPD